MIEQDCWHLWSDRGLLINPDPIARLTPSDLPSSMTAVSEIQATADELPALLASGRVHSALDSLPMLDVSPLETDIPPVDFIVIERLHQLYTYFASAYVFGNPEQPEKRIPASIAVPLVALSRMVERPPMLAYCNYVLNNWRRIDPNGAITVDNLVVNQPFLGLKDESWFALIHVEIEARGAKALNGALCAAQAADNGDTAGVIAGLEQVSESLHEMMRTFARMTEGCDPDVYYHQVRPYMFGFDDVVYEGVGQNGGEVYSARGQSAAQSSIIPALVAALGIRHEQSAMTQHLDVMKTYMPKPHRELIATMGKARIRPFVQAAGKSSTVANTYNACLKDILGFRKLHFHFASVFVLAKSDNPIGTGGTVFTEWLRRLIDETEQHTI